MALDHVTVIKFHGHLVFMILFLWLNAAVFMVMSSSYNISKPGCSDRCGNISIPYPFGIGDENCFLDKSFNITCDETVNPHKASFYGGNHELLDINLQLSQLRANVLIASICYDKKGNQITGSIKSSDVILEERFTFFTTRNKFVAIGCDTIAYMRGKTSLSTCTSTCHSIKDVINGSCSGSGCCEAPVIAPGLIYWIELNTNNKHTEIWDFNPCSYGFLVEENWFEFSSLALYDNQNRSQVPVVIDWVVGNHTCEEAKKNLTGTYTCGVNSECYNPSNGYRYGCKCLDGYEGNPYLTNGCQDINECDESRERLCADEAQCNNTNGSYTCACLSGYPGTKQGIDCLPQKRKFAPAEPFGIGIGIIVVLLVLAFGFRLYHRYKKRNQMKRKYFETNGGLLLKQKISAHQYGIEKAKIFSIKELEKATNKFNQSQIIGKGGFGTVYKGMLSDGRIVAIKKSKLLDQYQVDQFINEVAILSQIIHRHAVKLLGCCLETHVPLLVYEYVSNGTLSQHLHSEGYVSSMSWKDRLRIAAEIARALAYMHSEASIPIYHRDIKSTNILLDETYRAKVSDFGLSRSVSIEQTHLSTIVRGTFGYLDPEYFHSGQFTDKSDVYSFGVVLVELLTGETALSLLRSDEEINLAMYFKSSMKQNRLFEIIEARVAEEGDKDEVMIVAKLAERCLKYNGKKRPLMKAVSASLERLLMLEEISYPCITGTTFEDDDISLLSA